MSTLFAKGALELSSFLISPSPHLSQHQRRITLRTPSLRVTTLYSLSPKRSQDAPFITDHLVDSLGFSFQRALTLSTDPHLSRIESLDQWVDELVAAGCTKEILVRLIKHNPSVFALNNPASQLRFWREFVGNDDKVLLKIFKYNRSLFHCNIEENVVPRLNLFREYGLSHQQIVSLLWRNLPLMRQNLDNVKWAFEKMRELGILSGCKMFLECVMVLGYLTESTFNQKIEFYKNYGWSKEDVCYAFRKFPRILSYTEGRLNSHMDFLIKKAGLDPRSIASQPHLLGYSLKRRLVPRHHLLTILKAHEVKDYKLSSACALNEGKFLERIVVPHEKDVPGLREAYEAACSG